MVTAGASATAQSKPLRDIAVALATTVISVDQATYTSLPVGLRFWEQEGLRVTFRGVPGSAQAAQLVLAGSAVATHAGTSAALFVPRAQGLPMRSFYNSTPNSFQLPAVPADSPIRSVKDFAGKRIGVQSLGSGTVPLIRAMLEEAGLNPERDVTFVPVGLGPSAAVALFVTRQVDVLGLWDGQYAIIENIDPRYRLRTITSPLTEKIGFQIAFITTSEIIRREPDVVLGLGRGMAKATVFALTNPEAAVRIHWRLYPESKPRGDETAALEASIRVLRARLENMRIDRASPPRTKWGYHDPEEVRFWQDFLIRSGELKTRVPAADHYTNMFVGAINAFDQGAVQRMARTYRP